MKYLSSSGRAVLVMTVLSIFPAAVLCLPAGASMPVPVKTVEGLVRGGQITIIEPQRFASNKPLEIVPCSNIPFDPDLFEGRKIRATAGIDLYNGMFTCPTDVVILDKGPQDKACSFSRSCLEYHVQSDRKTFTPATLQDEKLSLKLGTFVLGLEKTVNAHDWKRLMEDYIHHEYLQKQHDSILQKNTPQFLYELLFPGIYKMQDLSICCMNYLLNVKTSFQARIDMIQEFEVITSGEYMISYMFTYKDGSCLIYNSIYLEKQEDGFKLTGAYG